MKLKVTRSGVIKTCAAKLVKKEMPGSSEKHSVRVIDFSAEMAYNEGDLSYLLGVNSKAADDIGYDSAAWSQIVGNFAITINEVYIGKVNIMKVARKNCDKGNTYTVFFRTEDIENATILSNYINDTDSLAAFMLESEKPSESEDKT
jgi:hypothetical protein